MYRIKAGEPEVFLVHPGGPFWKNKDVGVWSIPKGEIDGAEDLLAAAEREFEEETAVKPSGPFSYLGTVERPGKIVHAWAFQGDCDPAKIKSNTIMINWPPRSGKQLESPEVDRAGFFTLVEAKEKLIPYQLPLLENML